MTAPASDDEDALFDSLDNDTDPTLAHLRESRIQQLSHSLKTVKQQHSAGFGAQTHLRDEKTLMETTTSSKHCVVHFYKEDFNRCRIMDSHLSALAASHVTTRFLKIDVQDAPFLVTKLGVKVLPCVIAFIGGVSADRIVGFEGLGYGGDGFETGDLEKRLVRAGVLEEEKGVGDVGGRGREKEKASRGLEKRGTGGDGEDDNDDDDWD